MPNTYQMRTLTRAVRSMPTPGRAFLDTFYGGAPEYHDTRYLEAHFQRGGRNMAAFVEPHLPAHVSDRDSFKAGVVKVPYVQEKRSMKPGDTRKVQPGQHIYDVVDPNTQAETLLRKDLQDLKNLIAFREEWMGAKGLLGGVVLVQGDGIDATITFPYLSTHKPTLAAGDKWDQSTAEIIEQFREWGRLIAKDSDLAATDAFLGSNAVDLFLRNSKVQAYFDLRNVDIGMIDMRRQNAAGTEKKIKIGTVEGVDIYEIREYDPDGNELMGANAMLLGSNQAQNVRHYGLIEDFDEQDRPVSARTDWFSKSWVEKEPPVRWTKLVSSPLPMPHDIDGFVYVDDVHTA